MAREPGDKVVDVTLVAVSGVGEVGMGGNSLRGEKGMGVPCGFYQEMEGFVLFFLSFWGHSCGICLAQTEPQMSPFPFK